MQAIRFIKCDWEKMPNEPRIPYYRVFLEIYFAGYLFRPSIRKNKWLFSSLNFSNNINLKAYQFSSLKQAKKNLRRSLSKYQYAEVLKYKRLRLQWKTEIERSRKKGD